LEHDAVGRSQDEGGHGCRIHPGRQLTPISLTSDLSSENPRSSEDSLHPRLPVIASRSVV
jgi:hypothetical protein